MSLILDALKKADSKRTETPEHHTEELAVIRKHLTEQATTPKNRPTIRTAIYYGLLICTLCTSLYFIFSKRHPVTQQTTTLTKQKEIITPTEKNITHKIKITPAINTYKENSEINALYAQAENQRDKTSGQTHPNIASLYKDNQNTKNNQTVKAQGIYSSINLLKAMPASFQQTIPTLLYTHHDNASSSVIINRRTYYAGDTLKTGITLEAILEDGIILKKAETLFKLNIRNSWVNL